MTIHNATTRFAGKVRLKIKRPRCHKSVATRVHRHRARRKLDRAVFPVEADFYPLADKLVEVGFLEEWDMDNRAKVCAALERYVAEWVRYE
jgi:hypothetical protein